MEISAILSLWVLGLVFQPTSAQLGYCESSLCQNGGTCMPTATVYGFKCICPPGFDGINCQSKISKFRLITGGGTGPKGNSLFSFTEVDAKDSENPESFVANLVTCLNGGSFVGNGLPCRCPRGFSGNQCEVSIGSADIVSCPCKNGGKCIRTAMDRTECSCRFGFTGNYCEFSPSFSVPKFDSRLGLSVSSILPILVLFGIFLLCLYCVYQKNKNFPKPYLPSFLGRSMIPDNRPFQQVQPMQVVNPRPPPVVNHPQPMPDPDQVFQTNNPPPPYESVVANRPS